MISVIDSGALWVNPDPDLRSLHAWHPTLARLGGGRWLCTFDIASAALAHDYATWVAESTDDGRTWSEPWRLAPFEPADGPDRTGYTQLLDKPFPIWIRYQDEAEVGVEGVTNTAIYIQGSSFWYALGFQCHAPSGADDAAQAAFQTQCDILISHLLDSFQILH